MAVLALGFVGSAIGGGIGGSILGVGAATIGGFIGSKLGGLIDNMLFAGSTKVEGPRLDDKRVMASTYGLTLPVVYGPENRISGAVIWSPGLIETVKRTKQGGKGGPSVTTTEYSYRTHVALALADRECVAVDKIWANSKLIYDASGVGSPPITEVVFAAVRFYPGNGTQLPDPLIESFLGVDDTPAYRHTCYIVIEDLQLADFGNRLPNLEVRLKADETISLPAVVADLATRCGADPNEISTSSLPRTAVRGYVLAGATRAVDAFQPLALAYAFDATEQGGNLRFIARGRGAKGTMPLDDLGAYEGFDSEVPEPIRYDLLPPTALPQETVITYADSERDYQRNSQTARRQFGEADSNLSHDLPLVLTDDQGKHIADRTLYEAWTGRRVAAFSSTERYRSAQPGDCYYAPSPAGFTRLKITRRLRGANGLVEFETRQDDPTIYDSNAIGVGALIPEQTIRPVGETDLILLDAPLLRDADDDTGFYFLGVAQAAGWRGADVSRSSDGGSTFLPVDSLAISATAGTVASALAAGPENLFDAVNVITVVLDRDDFELESASELEVLNGANIVWLGDPLDSVNGEVLQFTTATLTAPRTYQLSGLLRGRAGTEFAIGLHGTSERLVVLETGSLDRIDYGPGDWNKARLYKAVSALTDPTAVAAETFTNTGESKRPLSPVHVAGLRDVSENLTITWLRRSRFRQPGLGNGALPLGEAFERYEVDILDGATVVRTIIVEEETAEYTAAEQTTDGLTPGDPVSLRVYQISDVRGRGHPAAATV